MTAGTRPARRVRRAAPLPNSVRSSASIRTSGTVSHSSYGYVRCGNESSRHNLRGCGHSDPLARSWPAAPSAGQAVDPRARVPGSWPAQASNRRSRASGSRRRAHRRPGSCRPDSWSSGSRHPDCMSADSRQERRVRLLTQCRVLSIHPVLVSGVGRRILARSWCPWSRSCSDNGTVATLTSKLVDSGVTPISCRSRAETRAATPSTSGPPSRHRFARNIASAAVHDPRAAAVSPIGHAPPPYA